MVDIDELVSGLAKSEAEYVEQRVKEAIAYERERIIALLETHHRETQGRGDLAVKYESAVLRCLALIKGENK